MMDSYSLIDFSACSANRSEHDGLSNLYYEKISDENFHLIRKITVDLKYGDQSHEPRVLCPGDRINLQRAGTWRILNDLKDKKV